MNPYNRHFVFVGIIFFVGCLVYCVQGMKYGVRFTLYDKKVWQITAKDYCKDRGDHLPTIKTMAEFKAFQLILGKWLSAGLLTSDFWMSVSLNILKINEPRWHDGTLVENNLGFDVPKGNVIGGLCYKYSLTEPAPHFRQTGCLKQKQIICQRQTGLCEFTVHIDEKLSTGSRSSLGEITLEECETSCLNYDVIGEECVGFEMDGEGVCELLIDTEVIMDEYTSDIAHGITLYLKDCHWYDVYGNPSIPSTFNLYQFSLNVDQARQYCEYGGQHLVKLDYTAKIDAFNEFVQGWKNNGDLGGSSWIGLRYSTRRELYHWHDKQALATLDKWRSSEPDNTNSQQCVTMGTDLKWGTKECSGEASVLCEKDEFNCVFTEANGSPSGDPSLTEERVETETDCQNLCQTTSFGGEECTIYQYSKDTLTCLLFTGEQSLSSTKAGYMQKTCFHGHVTREHSAGIQYSFFDIEMVKSEADTFCDIIGESPLSLTNDEFEVFKQLVERRSDLNLLGSIWVNGSNPNTCSVIKQTTVLLITTFGIVSQACDVPAQVVCKSHRGDCVYTEVADMELSRADTLTLTDVNLDSCRFICLRTKFDDRVCSAVVHDGNLNCTLIMRSSTYADPPTNQVAANGKSLHYLTCEKAVYRDLPVVARRYGLHGIRLNKNEAENFCTGLGVDALNPSILPELISVFQAVAYWGQSGFLPDDSRLWTVADRQEFGRAYSDVMVAEDALDQACVAVNHANSSWTPLDCNAEAYVVCQMPMGSGECIFEQSSKVKIQDRSNQIFFESTDLASCQNWCTVLAATYAECIAVEIVDGVDCYVHFGEAVYFQSLPTTSPAANTELYVRRCYSTFDPMDLGLTADSYKRFDTLMNFTLASEACSTVGLSQIKPTADTLPLLAAVVNRTSSIWLPMRNPGDTWIDGEAVTWDNFPARPFRDGDCATLDVTQADLSWLGYDCALDAVAMCYDTQADCEFILHEGMALPELRSKKIVTSSDTNTCEKICSDVSVGSMYCNSFSQKGMTCYLNLATSLLTDDPHGMTAVEGYNTFVRTCRAQVTTIPEEPSPDVSSVIPDPSTTISESSSLDQSMDPTSLESTIQPSMTETNSFDDMGSTEGLESSSDYGLNTATLSEDLGNTATLTVDLGNTATLTGDLGNAATLTGDLGIAETLTGDFENTATVLGNFDETATLYFGTTEDFGNTISVDDSGATSLSTVSNYMDPYVRYVYEKCLCRCSVQLPDTPELMSIEVQGIQEDLLMDKKNLSATKRTKSSAPNKKKSAVEVGRTLGITVIAFLAALVFLMDFEYLFRVYKFFKDIKSAQSAPNKVDTSDQNVDTSDQKVETSDQENPEHVD